MYSNSHYSISWQYKVVIGVVVGLATLALLINLTRACLRNLLKEPPAGRANSDDRAPPLEVEMVVRSSSVGPRLVCTYRRADGWREATCGVCLSELADGESVRVLPACMHYFHDACVEEWLQARATCPLCRAATNLLFSSPVIPTR